MSDFLTLDFNIRREECFGDPFTPKSDQLHISPVAPPGIYHHTEYEELCFL